MVDWSLAVFAAENVDHTNKLDSIGIAIGSLVKDSQGRIGIVDKGPNHGWVIVDYGFVNSPIFDDGSFGDGTSKNEVSVNDLTTEWNQYHATNIDVEHFGSS